jgi:alpha-1,3-mannosyltransferase
LKIVHVTRLFWPSVGGIEETVLNLAQRQRHASGFDTSVVSLDHLPGREGRLPRREIVEGVPVARVAWRGSRRYPLAPGVLSHLREADLVHVHGIDFFFDFLAWTRPAHRRRLLASTHGGFFHTPYLAAMKQIYFATITRASAAFYDRIVACSEADAQIFRPIAGRKLAIIENGVDTEKFRDRGAREHSRTLIYFGRLASHKRIPALFEILRELRAHEADWQLIVAGGEADLTLASLQEEARRAGVAAAVRFVVEPSNRELADLIGAASYFACMSAYEGFGIAAVEALSAGLVPVLSDIAPFEKLVRQAGVGLTVDAARPAEAAACVLLASRATRRAHSAARASSIAGADGYSWARASDAYLEVYRSIAQSHGLVSRRITPTHAATDEAGKGGGAG